MTRVIENIRRRRCNGLLSASAHGDINPYYAVTPLKEDAVGRRSGLVRHSANRLYASSKTSNPSPTPNPSIEFVEEKLPMHIRWNIEGFRLGLKRFLGDAL